MCRSFVVASLACAAIGCGGDTEDVHPSSSGGAGGSPAGCPAGERPLEDGACEPAGVPPSECAPGFDPDGMQGCTARLPPRACAKGSIALPGETRCRLVAPCPAGRWPASLEPTTQYVDGTYVGGASDGSQNNPWITIAEAVAAAEPGGIVAITDGTYAEDVTIELKPVRIIGRCPGSVALEGTAAGQAALFIGTGADGTELRDIAVRGAGIGVFVTGSQDVLLDRVWIDAPGSSGLVVQNDFGPTSVMLTGSLVETATGFGVFLVGSELALDSTVVRGTRPVAGIGRGIALQESEGSSVPARMNVHASLIENNTQFGIFIGGSEATIEASLVRETLPADTGEAYGRGIEVQASPLNGQRARATIRASVVERSREVGISLHGADAVIEHTVVRDTFARPDDDAYGWGLAGQIDGDSMQRSVIEVRSSVVERSQNTGLSLIGSDGIIESCVSRATQPNANGLGGRGMNVQVDILTLERARATVRWSVIDDNEEAGITVMGSDATIEATAVRATRAHLDGLLGDGIAVILHMSVDQATALVTGAHIENNARAGLANFGSFVSLGASVLSCNAFDLEGASGAGAPYQFEDLGDNGCGCPEPTGACRAQSTGLEPPGPL